MLHKNTSNEFEVSRCWDAAFIDAVIAQLINDITTDQCPGVLPAQQVLMLPGVTFLQIGEFGKPAEGLGMIYGNEVHTLFLPSLRGGRAVRAAKAAMNWLWHNTQIDSFFSYVYSHRPEVGLFARLVGFEFFGPPEEGATVGGVPVTKYRLISHRPCPQQ